MTLTAAAASGAIEPEAIAPQSPPLIEEIRGCAVRERPDDRRPCQDPRERVRPRPRAGQLQQVGLALLPHAAVHARAERRSNFRDECLQHFGKDARMREASSRSSRTTPRCASPRSRRPSRRSCARSRTVGVPLAPTRGRRRRRRGRRRSAPRPMALPEEFMRGGGCFGPDATVAVARAGWRVACRARERGARGRRPRRRGRPRRHRRLRRDD